MYLICVNVQFLWFPLSLCGCNGRHHIWLVLFEHSLNYFYFFVCYFFPVIFVFSATSFFGESKIFGRLTDSAFSVLSR